MTEATHLKLINLRPRLNCMHIHVLQCYSTCCILIVKMTKVFEFHSCECGHHFYKSICSPSIGEVLVCDPEFGNIEDPYAVKVVTSGGTTVGHVPRRISTLCHLFLLKNGSIICQVSAKRRFSQDLPQGGLEVPCILTFFGLDKDIAKVIKLTSAAPTENITLYRLHVRENRAKNLLQITKKPKFDKENVDDLVTSNSVASEEDLLWLKGYGCFLIISDKAILEGGRLSDHHINFAQAILHLLLYKDWETHYFSPGSL